MIALKVAGSAGAIPAFVNEPDPAALRIISPVASDVEKMTPPATPAAPGWMCAALIGVPGGNPLKLTTNVAVPAVTFPAASFVTSKVIVAVPLPDASVPVIGGTSLAGRRSAVNVGLVGVVGDGDVDDLQPVAATRAMATAAKRFIACS